MDLPTSPLRLEILRGRGQALSLANGHTLDSPIAWLNQWLVCDPSKLPQRNAPREVTMDWKPHITADPQIMHGAVCFRGTRVPVSVVLDNLAAGETTASILAEYPTLRPEHIPAAIGYAAELARERIVPLPA